MGARQFGTVGCLVIEKMFVEILQQLQKYQITSRAIRWSYGRASCPTYGDRGRIACS
jgi:hypothetical protein